MYNKIKKDYFKYKWVRNFFYGVALAGFIGSGIFYLNSLDKDESNLKLKGTISYFLGAGSFVFGSKQNKKKKELEFIVKGP